MIIMYHRYMSEGDSVHTDDIYSDSLNFSNGAVTQLTMNDDHSIESK